MGEANARDGHEGSVEVGRGQSRSWLSRLGVAVACVAALTGCRDFFKSALDINLDSFDIGDITRDPTGGKKTGEACQTAGALSDCRFGLQCVAGTCQAAGVTPQNQPCVTSAECADGLYCALSGVCTPAGDGAVGTTCATAGDCEAGLVCLSLGFSGSCVAAGTGDIDAACATLQDCQAGLVCDANGACAAGSPVFGLRPWSGVVCENEDLVDPPVVHFEVPRAGTARDFFRLPFPNDIRMKNGRVDLSGFPTPGPGVVGFDPVARVIDAAEQVQTGFSNEPAVLFRLSRGFDLGSIWAGGIQNPPPGEPTLYFVNIDKASPQYKWTPDFGYFVTDGGSKYVCPRYVGVHPAWYAPLLPGTTYAVILGEGVKTRDGALFGADADMQAMLAEARPSEPELGVAWDRYQPLRDYLADEGAALPKGRVIAAAVFTTQRSTELMPKVREAIAASPMPQAKALTKCAAGVVSPCDDGLTGDAHVRGCFEEDDAFYELHLLLPLPKVQAGTRPYLRPEDGGGLVLDDAGRPILQGTEDVCVSMTIPKHGTMPSGGWPVAIYGHGTGGSFRSAVRDVGAVLADIDPATLPDSPPEAAPLHVATVGWDGPMHGKRRGVDLDPEGLFYNFANPLAARGNLVQGAADVFALVRVLGTWSLAADKSPTGEAIRFDPSRVLYVGHSQGATTGPLATAWEPGIGAVVWSGAGAGLVLSLLAKKSPVDAPKAVAIALQELDGFVPATLGDMHPALTLIQGLFDPVDPLNHARAATVERAAALGVQHVLHVYGLGDTYTPPATIETFARALRLAVANPVLKDLGAAFQKLEPPVKANLTEPGGAATAVMIQVQPDGYDGHFALFRDARAKRQFAAWVGTFVRDGVPTLIGGGP
jgi:hypothetical protein